MAVLNTGLAKVSGADFTLDQSLRFNDDDSAYLSRTAGTPTSARIGTFSVWVKPNGVSGSAHSIFGSYTGSSNRAYIRIHETSSQIVIYDPHSTGNNTQIHTTPVYRDPSAWMHILIAIDVTQGVAANRLKLYVNGVQVTDFETESYPDDYDQTFFEDGNTYAIGASYAGSLGSYMDGYLAEFHFIDGTQLTPASFGETGDYGEWKPIEVSGLTYGNNGFYLSFAGGGVMSATGGDSTDTDGDYKAASFTQDGTFTPSADGMVEYLVIAGGGGGGHTYYGGGGGAGGYRTGYLAVTESTAYAITVGDGGVQHTQGDNSSIASEVVSIGGGAGGNTTDSTGEAGGTGGSGGGGGNASGAGGSGTTGQGNDGGTAPSENYSAGGGGAGTAGSDNVGGNGLASSITGSSVTRAGGGGGGYHVGYGSGGTGGSGGGGQGGEVNDLVESGNGTPNTGSGGGGSGASDEDAGSGGSGIVIIRYKFQ